MLKAKGSTMFQKAIFLIGVLFGPFGCSGTEARPENTPKIRTANLNGAPVSLTLVGKATRTFTFLLAFDVYTIQLLVSDPSQFDARQPLKSLDKLKAVAVHITALMSVEGDRMRKSIKEALENNKVNIERESIQSLLDIFSISSEKGTVFSFTGKRLDNGTELVEIKLSGQDQPIVISEPGIIRDVFSTWLGDTSHSAGLTKLKEKLLSGQL